MTTVPGFSSRSTTSTVRQFPQRDEAVMSENTPGWSNSGAPEYPQVGPDDPETTPAPSSVGEESKTIVPPAPKRAARRKQGEAK